MPLAIHAPMKTGRLLAIYLLAVIAIGAAYGYSDEFHQRFTAGRTYDLADWGCDILGVSAAVLAFRSGRGTRMLWSGRGCTIM